MKHHRGPWGGAWALLRELNYWRLRMKHKLRRTMFHRNPAIVQTMDVVSGRPRLAGTRLSVAFFVNSYDEPLSDMARAWDYLSVAEWALMRETIHEVLAHCTPEQMTRAKAFEAEREKRYESLDNF